MSATTAPEDAGTASSLPAAALRVIARRMDLWGPHAKRALVACLLVVPSTQNTPPHMPRQLLPVAPHPTTTVPVEAMGSGVVIVPALEFGRDTTVGDVKELLRERAAAAGVRLFAGHGGRELCDDLQSMRAAVSDGATLVQLVEDDRRVLAQLLGTTGANRGGLGEHELAANWKPAVPLASWGGVTCDPSTGRVVKLKIESDDPTRRQKIYCSAFHGMRHFFVINTRSRVHRRFARPPAGPPVVARPSL
jgi:hypothetical protein